MWCLVLSSLATSFSPLLSLQCPLFVALTVSVIQFPVFFVEARARKVCLAPFSVKSSVCSILAGDCPARSVECTWSL